MNYPEYDSNKTYQLNEIVKFGSNTYKCTDKYNQYFEPLQKPKRPPSIKGPDIVVYGNSEDYQEITTIPLWLSIIFALIAFLIGLKL